MSTPEPSVQLRLYVAGRQPNSAAAVDNLRAALAPVPEAAVALEIIDVWDEPERARADRVMATPMLVRVAPEPRRVVIGDLRDRAGLRATIGVGDRGEHGGAVVEETG